MLNPWAKSKKEVEKELGTSSEGLSEKDAKKRLSEYGKNKIEEKKKFALIKLIFEQFNSPLIYILLFAMLISYLLKKKLDAIVILVIIIINVSIGFFQQYRAENTINNLKKFMIPKTNVIRENKTKEISSESLVPGDVAIINAGEKISADLRIIESENLTVNEAALTGESMPVSKEDKRLKKDLAVSKRSNMLFAGTEVVTGSAKAIVTSTGESTEFGDIAGKLQEIDTQKTPMQKRVEKFSKQIGVAIVLLVLAVLFFGLLAGNDFFDMLMVAITLSVGAIPEGLPTVMAIAFSVSSRLMAKRNVVIRRLPAVESLGSVSVICTDKTGTITEEKMTVQKIFADNTQCTAQKNELLDEKNKRIDPKKNKQLDLLIKTSVLASNARFERAGRKYNFIGEPTETALVSNALDLGYSRKTLTEEMPRMKTFEFDSKRKLMSIVRKNKKDKTLFSKGAPEKILNICSYELKEGEKMRLTEKRKEELLGSVKKMEEDALRVLGFAYRDFRKKENEDESDLVFLGFIGMMDPPRKEVKKAVKLCREAGIDLKMITGDSLVTARSIAKKVGITGQGIDSEQLSRMSERELSENIEHISVFARATPEQKLRVEKALQKKGHTVAMTGDGVNDVLALKSADVGISMGVKGTDVARDVSDIILLDDNFASIVNGVQYGRITYDNIKKFTKYMLAVNFDTLILVTLTAILKLPLPILPIQILWKNVITDAFPSMTLVFEKDDGVMQTAPRKEKSPLEGTYFFLFMTGLLNLIVCSIVYFYGVFSDIPIETTRTMVMTTDIFFELFFIYTCRSTKPLRKIGIFSNKLLNFAVFGAILTQLTLLYTPLGSVFHLVPFRVSAWLYILPLTLSGLVIYELIKEVRYRRGVSRKDS